MLLYTLPLIGALIGWLTNYIAIKMLFHPRNEVRIFFIPVQGVFPKRQKDLARKLGHIISEELVSVEDLTTHLKEKATSEAILNHIAQRLEEGIASRLPRAFPMLAMFMSSDMIEKIKDFLLGQIGSLNEELIDKLSYELEEELDVHRIVEEKVAAFSTDKLEEILFSIMRREFKFVEMIGAVLGFLIGVAQILILSLPY
ncbi:MAG: DUF445 family protein [Deltaproteobacteria bacterium]|jgi:uncharacterized membrane protein YheB (UPF0754 family)|nr:DUF445 family protein [Deltaproteobacteria bacterium]